MAKHRANECKGINYEPRKAYNANANNDNNYWDDQPQQHINNNINKSNSKTKRNELSSDDESDKHGRSF